MSQDIQEEKQQINSKIEHARERIVDLENDLRLADGEYNELLKEQQKYFLLSEIADRLDKLQKVGGAALFWGKDFNETDSSKHYERINNQVINYEDQLQTIHNKRESLKDDIQTVLAQIDYLEEEIIILNERAEERDHQFVIEREMTVEPYRVMEMPWNKRSEDERLFRKVLLVTLLVSLLLGLLIPMWNLPIPEKPDVIEVPERLAKLIVEKQPPPPPPKPVEQKKPEELKPKEKRPRKEAPKPKTKAAKVARKKAESTGLLAFKDDFADLMDVTDEAKLGTKARIKSAGQKQRKATRSLVTAMATGSSKGINTSSLSRNVGGGGKGMKGVEFSRIESAIGTEFSGEERPLSEGPGPSRTDEEIQIVFDRYKAALYRIYNRELRKNPGLQGKLVLRITIQPDGSVSMCKLESSDMKAPELEKKIVARVKLFNFGKKDGVPPLTILYPIDFLPAS